MNPEATEPLTPDEARARAAVRALPREGAHAAFRERLKRDFASGRIGERRAIAFAPPSRPVWWWVWAPAAAVLLAIVVPMANRGPAWEVMSAGGDGMVVVGDRPIPANHLDELRRAIRPGMRLRTMGPVELDLAAPGTLMIQVTANSDLILPEAPPRWFGRASRARFASGEVRITSGPRFLGARLAIDTPEAHVEVTGTTLAVIREPAGTCVCVMEGSVRVGALAGAMERVEAGRRIFVFNDGRPIERAEMRSAERVPLGELRHRHAAGSH